MEKSKKRKKWPFILAIILLVILLFPRIGHATDGGTVYYKAVFYEVVGYHKIDDRFEGGYFTGVTVKILGFEVYNNTPQAPLKEEQTGK